MRIQRHQFRQKRLDLLYAVLSGRMHIKELGRLLLFLVRIDQLVP